MKTLVALGVIVLTGCATGPTARKDLASTAPKLSGKTERAAVVVRECLGSGDRADTGSATVFSTARALRLEVNCGKRPFRIIYRTGEEQYAHYDVAAGEKQTFTTDQVKELLALRASVAKASAEAAVKGGTTDERKAMTALLTASPEEVSPLKSAKFVPASIGETVNSVRCRRFDITSGKELVGEACLTKADSLKIPSTTFASFTAAREKFQGLLGTGFEIFDPMRKVSGVDYLVVHLAFGDGRRGIAVPRLKSVAMQEVPVEVWDPARITDALP